MKNSMIDFPLFNATAKRVLQYRTERFVYLQELCYILLVMNL